MMVELTLDQLRSLLGKLTQHANDDGYVQMDTERLYMELYGDIPATRRNHAFDEFEQLLQALEESECIMRFSMQSRAELSSPLRKGGNFFQNQLIKVTNRNLDQEAYDKWVAAGPERAKQARITALRKELRELTGSDEI